MTTIRTNTGTDAYRLAQSVSGYGLPYFLFACTAQRYGMRKAAEWAKQSGVSLSQCLQMARVYARIGYYV